jgi:hypothetical protein
VSQISVFTTSETGFVLAQKITWWGAPWGRDPRFHHLSRAFAWYTGCRLGVGLDCSRLRRGSPWLHSWVNRLPRSTISQTETLQKRKKLRRSCGGGSFRLRAPSSAGLSEAASAALWGGSGAPAACYQGWKLVPLRGLTGRAARASATGADLRACDAVSVMII